MKDLNEFPRRSSEKTNIIDLFVLVGQKTPIDVFREYWYPENHFIVTKIYIPRDKQQNIIYEKIIVIGDFYKGTQLKDQNVHLKINSWNALEWGFYVRPPQ